MGSHPPVPNPAMLPIANTVLPLTLSNVFMTLPAHLKEMAHKPLIVAALIG